MKTNHTSEEEQRNCNEKENFNAEEFVDNLINEGAKVHCDNTSQKFTKNDVPEFYDAEKYKRGQQFFRENIFGLYFSKLLGLLTVLAIPTVLKILMMTKMSSSKITAYKRYMSTILHMNIWYRDDFKPGSKLWESVAEVKNKHNSASRRAVCSQMGFINQKDMAITQFGFMGFAIIRPEYVGIHSKSTEDFEAFVHVWRVVGSIMGLEDRFNICRESLEETRAICEALNKKVLLPLLREKDSDFLEMTRYLCEGLWHFQPLLDHRVFMTYLFNTLSENTENCYGDFFKLKYVEQLNYNLLVNTVNWMKFNIIRHFVNFIQNMSLWIMDTFPFLAIYNFGSRNAYVKVLNVKKSNGITNNNYKQE